MATTIREFSSNYQSHADRLLKSGEPELVEVDEEHSLVVQEAKAYEELMERLEFLEDVEAVREGIRSMEAGKGVPAPAALEKLRQELGIPER